MGKLAIIYAATFLCGLAFGALFARAAAPEGKDLFENRCGGCHSLDKAKEGPPLRGVFGRPAGSVKDFPYSDALRAAKFTWDEATLDKWLTDPDAFVAGNDMAFRVANPAERAAIIGYLKEIR